MSFGYKPAFEGPVRLVTIVDPANRIREGNERNQVQVTNLWAGPKGARVLVVDDDQVLGHENAIQGALAANGIPYATYGAHPSYAVLKHFKAVVWSSGVDRYEGQLNQADRVALTKYLDRGGKVILTGNRIMDAITTQGSPQTPASAVSFGAHYFGVRTPEGNPSYIVTQGGSSRMTGIGILKGVVARTHPSPARQFVGLAGLAQDGTGFLGTTIKPFGKASGLVEPDANLLGAVTKVGKPYIGVSVDGDAKHGSFRTAVLGWNIGDDDYAASTVRLVNRLMKHFGVGTGRALKQKKRLIYHTAVRDSVSGRPVVVTAVSIGATPPTVSYRRHNKGRFYTAVMKKRGPNAWSFAIPARAVTPDGVDYFIRAGKTYAPYGASGGPLYYSIAVAMPVVKNPLPVK